MSRPRVYTACRDCRKCTNPTAANAARDTGRVSLAILTVGISEMALALKGKCRLCGHRMSLHGAKRERGGPTVRDLLEQRRQRPAPTPVPPDGLSAELVRLATLHHSGQLTDDEYERAKARVLGGAV